ncbi:TPA: hypothetical protein N0F65_006631 [Lagenidium giganteum]|uniref:Pyridoxal phosphate homeostasis protein n=1 Tax=Lagenidium giganteum TaxID=4803 RepID=A0AAV2Z956_9STRA|nr:TPA: hypothetical protein N0F65_006631 [Lagenidium giganteum]
MSASTIVRNLHAVRERLQEAVAKSTHRRCTLVAVSKTKPIEDLQAVYQEGQRHFGENYIQELIEKVPQMPNDVLWHYIGHVQSNKAKMLVRDVPNLFMVETVDSIKIANALNKASGEFRTTQLNVMVQVNTSEEEQKSGVTMEESVQLAEHIVSSCEHLQLMGLMTIGRYGDTTSECFDRLVACRKLVAQRLGKQEQDLELSMGITFVRVGSTIFGERNYSRA